MHFLSAFLVGGLLCVLAQIFIDKTSLTPARILVLYVVSGTVLSAFGLYQPLVDIAGAGATVPLLGFGHSLMQGVKQAVDQNGVFGILVGGLSGTAAGITAVMVFSVLACLVFHSHRK